MRKKKVHHEEHVDETWLIPYADMLTLLLALFIVMFAMSKTDQAKFKKISEQFNVIFSGGSASGSGFLEGEGTMTIPSETPSNTIGISKTAAEEEKMNEIKQVLEQEIEKRGYGDKVRIDVTKEGLDISIQDVVLFNSGDAKVIKEVSPLLLQISTLLNDLGNDIKIVGHTDNVPISTSTFRSNWDLSTIRAINVMQFMSESGGIPPSKMSIQAYGEYMPKFDNSTEIGRAKNRRVEIFVVRKYPTNTNTNTK